MKKKVFYPAALFLVLVFLISCSPGQAKPFETDGFAMGTVISQRIYGSNNAKEVSIEVFDKLHSLEALMTINAPGGDINKLNENAGKGYVTLNPETISVLKSAQEISRLSNGKAFDITVGPLVKAWGIGTDKEQIPPDATIRELLPLINYTDVHIDEAGKRASLQKPGQMVDLGGIAKGYAGDVVKEIYRKHGIESAFINIGGNVVVLGSRPDGRDWSIGIQNPRAANGEIVGFVHVSDKAVVTSGDYQRYFEKDGRRYCHILDPQTGYPIDSGLISVTVIAASSTDADGLSKAIVLGLDKGMDLIKRYGRAEAIFITSDKKIFVTPGLKENFQLKDSSNEYTFVKER